MILKSLVAAGLLLSVGACSLPTHKPGGPSAGLPPPPAARQGAVNYRIDPEQSELRLLVYKAGAMARLGHNHVILNRRVAGWVHWVPRLAGSAFAMQFRADGFVVDEEATRAEEGDDFAAAVDEDAKRGTLHNMLGADLLNAQGYPAITIRSVGIEGEEPELTALVSIEVAGHETQVSVPLSLRRTAERISAGAEFTLRQSRLGLKPFSIMLGALQVRDEFTVKCKIVASAALEPAQSSKM